MKQTNTLSNQVCKHCGGNHASAKCPLIVPVVASIIGRNRTFVLRAPCDGHPCFEIRFDVPRELRAAKPELPKTVWQSTGTSLIDAARVKARTIIENVFSGRTEERAEAMLAKPRTCTLGELIDAYDPDPSDVSSPLTIAGNVRSLLQIVREGSECRGDARELRGDVWGDPAVWENAVEKRKRAARELDLVKRNSAYITLARMLAKAKSVFSPKVAACYKNLRLPELAPLRAVKGPSTAAVDQGYKEIPAAVLAAMRADAVRLKHGTSELAAKIKVNRGPDKRPRVGLNAAEQLAVYKLYLLMLALGLRNVEAYNARESWIKRDGRGGAVLAIERRTDFASKNGRYGDIPISPSTLAELDFGRDLNDRHAFIISPADEGARFQILGNHAYEICYRYANDWIRHFLPDRNKGVYELRKHAGSIVYNRPESEGGGLVNAAAFLRDSIATVTKHYLSPLGKVAGITLDEVTPTLRLVA